MDVKELMKELADRIQQTANVRAVFGEPMGHGMDMIIPVARVSVRGGGGGGADAGEDQGGKKGRGSGMGMGMNITTSPVGYIQNTPEGARFVSVVDRNRILLAGLGVAAIALWVLKIGAKGMLKNSS